MLCYKNNKYKKNTYKKNKYKKNKCKNNKYKKNKYKRNKYMKNNARTLTMSSSANKSSNYSSVTLNFLSPAIGHVLLTI